MAERYKEYVSKAVSGVIANLAWDIYFHFAFFAPLLFPKAR